jgi:hypothetical protein
MGCFASQLSADETLVIAAEKGDWGRLRVALDDGAHVDAKDAVRAWHRFAAPGSCTLPLCGGCAALTPPTSHALCRFLAAQIGVTALHNATLHGHDQCVQLLLERGASVNCTVPVRRCSLLCNHAMPG